MEFILVYADSVETTDPKDKRSEKARELHKYLTNNKEGLLPYQKQGKEIPAPKEGIIYKNMGVQESQNCTVITLRMKHRRMRWSVKGARGLGDLCYARTEVERRAHEMQTFLHELRKLKKCQRTLDTNLVVRFIDI